MANIPYSIEIMPATNGFVVKVGCMHAVAKDNEIEEVFDWLRQYIRNPVLAQKKWYKKCGLHIPVLLEAALGDDEEQTE